MNYSNNNLNHSLSAVFKDPLKADQVYYLALQKGYKKENINVFMSEETKNKNYANNNSIDSALSHNLMEGAGVGGAIGTTAGAIAGAISAIGTNLVLPGLGLVIVGPIAAALAGAGAGGIAGGVLGALVKAGFAEDYAKDYEKVLKEGGVVITISNLSEDACKALEADWKSLDGTNFVMK